MNDIYVPIISEENSKLYLVESDFQTTDSSVFSICNKMKGQGYEGINLLIDKISSYYKDCRRVSLKLKEENSNKFLSPDAISLNTQSIALGLLIKVIIQNENKKIFKDFDKIIITGNFFEDRLVSVDDISKKYSAIPKDNTEEILFIYVSDDDKGLDDIYNVTKKQFNPKNDNLDDVLNFIFSSYIVDIDYDPINRNYSVRNPELLDDIIYSQLENKNTGLQRNSFQINILIDETIYPKKFGPRIIEVYAFIKRQTRLLSTCLIMLFSIQFKTIYSAISCNYRVVIENLLDSILCYKPESIDYSDSDRMITIDVIQKSKYVIHNDNEKDFLISPSIRRSDWIKVFKKNLFLSGMDEETNLKIIYESIVKKNKPFFPVIEIQFVLGSDWMSKCFLPELLSRFSLFIENEVVKEEELNLENIFDTNKWFVMGEH